MINPKYKCKNCGYQGKKFIFQLSNYGYCFASNEEESDYLSRAPKWVEEKGDAEIGEPVGCPKCRSWGIDNFEMIS